MNPDGFELQDTREERDKIIEHRAVYDETHRKFKPTKLNFIQEFGIEVFLSVLSGIGAVVLAAISTGAVFMVRTIQFLKLYSVIPDTATSILGYISMVAALLAVEGFLASRGMAHGRKYGLVARERWGMVAAFAVSILANVDNSSALINGLPAVVSLWLGILLVLVSGVGATALAYFGMASVGSVFFDWQQLQKRQAEEDAEREDEWYAGFRSDYSRKNRSNGNGHSQYNNRERKSKQFPGDVQVTPYVRQWLADHNLQASQIGVEAGDIATPAQIVDDLYQQGIQVNPNAVRTALSRLREKQAYQ